MKLIDKTNSKTSLAHTLGLLLPQENMVLYPFNDYGAHSNFEYVIALKPTESFDKLDGFGTVIGGTLASDPNHVVLYERTYLPMIQKMVELHEKINKGEEVTVEVRAADRKDYFRMPRDRM